MIIKVCGMRDAENIREVERLGIDMMGFICWERSPRYVREVPAYLPKCPRVGVFVNQSLDEIQKRMEAFDFSYIQLHGSESPEFCKEVREKTGCKVIKAISINRPTHLQTSSSSPLKGEESGKEASPLRGGLVGSFEGCANLLLFDTKCSTMGGSGKQFNWDILSDYRGDLPFLLSGGIGPEDAERLRQFHHPKCLGFDINSRFEIEPGIKDTEKIKQFITAIRED
ncbi:MAG: phosphoribosylanthranilate isomerase [Bacteroidaceae bacterium]|nr:phosphoribosylanthranilate isomerase [Bacteroidaceae bacterium]